MIHVRKAGDRGQTESAWLHSWHTFSFGGFHDPAQMGFRSLRVINEDVVRPGKGFATHGHKDAEIFSYVLEGELEHKDSMGNGSVIKAGNLQYMSAGDGVTHSEFNPSKTEHVHFLQIWLLPNQSGGKPIYAERELAEVSRDDSLTLLFAGRARAGAIAIRQDADFYLGKLADGRNMTFELPPDRAAWVQMTAGSIKVLGETLVAGDGAAISDVALMDIRSVDDARFLFLTLT